MRTISHEVYLQKRLKDREFAAGFLTLALAEDTPREFLASLKSVIMAHGGVARIAKKSGISRQQLYRIIGGRGNPTIYNLRAILDALQIQFKLDYKKPSKKLA